jgi:hypothetical protein
MPGARGTGSCWIKESTEKSSRRSYKERIPPLFNQCNMHQKCEEEWKLQWVVGGAIDYPWGSRRICYFPRTVQGTSHTGIYWKSFWSWGQSVWFTLPLKQDARVQSSGDEQTGLAYTGARLNQEAPLETNANSRYLRWGEPFIRPKNQKNGEK